MTAFANPHLSLKTMLGLDHDPGDQVTITFTGPVERLELLKERLSYALKNALKFGAIVQNGDYSTLAATYQFDQQHSNLQPARLIDNLREYFKSMEGVKPARQPLKVVLSGELPAGVRACQRLITSAKRGASLWIYEVSIKDHVAVSEGYLTPEWLNPIPPKPILF